MRFALLILQGNTAAERGAAFVREELSRLGIVVDVVALEFGAFIERLVAGKYDAVYYRLQTTDADPAVNLDFWLSSGSAHVWNIGQAVARHRLRAGDRPADAPAGPHAGRGRTADGCLPTSSASSSSASR